MTQLFFMINLLLKFNIFLMFLTIITSCSDVTNNNLEKSKWDDYKDSLFLKDHVKSKTAISLIESLKYKLVDSDYNSGILKTPTQLTDTNKLFKLLNTVFTVDKEETKKSISELLYYSIDNFVTDLNLLKVRIDLYNNVPLSFINNPYSKPENTTIDQWAYNHFHSQTTLESLNKLKDIQNELLELEKINSKNLDNLDTNIFHIQKIKTDSLKKQLKTKSTPEQLSNLNQLCNQFVDYIDSLKSEVLFSNELSNKEFSKSTKVFNELLIGDYVMTKYGMKIEVGLDETVVLSNKLYNKCDSSTENHFLSLTLDGFSNPLYSSNQNMKNQYFMHLMFKKTPTIIGLYQMEKIKYNVLKMYDTVLTCYE